MKWNDLNGDGVRGSGEPGIADVTINLDLGDDGSVDRTTETAADGSYRFPDVPPGTHKVTEVAPAGMAQTHPAAPGHYIVNLPAGVSFRTANFGNWKPPAQPIPPPAGLVSWWPGDDHPKDIMDGHHGMLMGDTSYAAGMVGPAFDLDGDGDYVKVGIAPDLGLTGDFTVDAWIKATELGGGTRVVLGSILANNRNNQVLNLSIQNGKPYFGFWNNDTQGNMVLSPNVWYHLAWRYDSTTQQQAIFVNGVLDATGDNHQPFEGLIDEVELFNRPLTDSEIKAIFDAGPQGKMKPATIMGMKYHDLNGNGQRDPGEWTIPNVTINLDLANDGSTDRTAVTAPDGSYTFSNVPPGTHKVNEVAPAGFVQTAPPAPGHYVVTVGPGQNLMGMDFGNKRVDSISGVKYHDITGNGVREPWEPSIAGVTINLDLGNDGGTPDRTTTTDATGFYLFPNVPAGAHRVSEVIPAGFIQTQPASPGSYVVSIVSGSAVATADFGNKRTQPIQAPAGMVTWWPGDGNSNDIVDGHHGVPTGDTTYSPGMVGMAFDLDGNGDYVDVGIAPELGLTGDFTVDAWIKATELGGGTRVVLGSILADNRNNQVLNLSIQNGKPYFGFWNNDTPGKMVLSPNVWYHIAWRYDSSTQEQAIFVNGVLDAQSGNHAAFEGPDDIAIGQYGDGNFFKGLIDEVKLFNRPLTEAEIRSIFEAGMAGKVKDSDIRRVTKPDDTNDGTCDQDCSLREAIAVADSGDTIIIPIGTYTLTLGAELAIGTNLTLNGAGSGDTIIQAAASSADATTRVFNITGGVVAIAGATIRHGRDSGFGGGIFNAGGTLTLTLTLTNSTLSGNTASGGGGSGGRGGGITNFGTLTLTNSTLSGNTASGGFGSSSFGGGIGNFGTLTLTNSTLSGNTASGGGGSGGSGGGITNFGTLTLTNSIIAGNSGGDCDGSTTSLGYNLIGNNTGCSFTAAAGDLVGNGANPIDPLLGPLQDNGGSTLTHALLDGSPAIDQIPAALCVVSTDQRGVLRPQGSACDIGAYELPAPASIDFSGPRAQQTTFDVPIADLPDVGAIKTQGILASDRSGPTEPFLNSIAYLKISSPKPQTAPYAMTSTAHQGFSSLAGLNPDRLSLDINGASTMVANANSRQVRRPCYLAGRCSVQ